MTVNRWSRTEQLFHELLELPPALRHLRLEALARDDREHTEYLQRLLVAAATEQIDDDFSSAVGRLVEGVHLPAGTMIGPYRLAGEIATGGMGSVYRAVHDETQREVAIKVVNQAWAASPPDHARLVREYRLVASLDDEPRIARLYDVGTLDDGSPWFAMELVRGGMPLTHYCVRHALPLAARLDLFREVCLAVMHAHGRAVVHRDLKPSNILVSEKGEVKLLDFGIAGPLADLNQEDDRHDVSARSLTPAYAAPEQLTNQPVAAFTDLYVLGLLLFELLTDRRPFADGAGRTVADVLPRMLEPPPRPSAVRAVGGRGERADWGDLDAICVKLLAVDPRARYRSAERLVEDLTRYRTGLPVLARGATRMYRARKFLGRHRRPLAAAAVAVFALAALSFWYGLGLARERRATLAQVARTERLQQFMIGLLTGAEPEVGPARELTVRRLLERGVLTANTLTGDPDIQAELTHTLGTMYRELGDFGHAEALLQQSLMTKAGILPADDPRRIEGQIALADLRIEQMQLDAADTLARSSLETLRRTQSERHPLVIRAQLALGRALTARGKYADAIAHFETVRDGLPDGVDALDESAVLTQLANAYQYAGQLDAAEALNRSVLELDRRVRGSRHPLVADDLINLGDAEITRGRYAEAEPKLREALTIFRGWYGSDHPETGSAARILANALMMQGKLDESTALLTEARAIFARVYPGPHRRIGLVLNDLGSVALRQKRHEDAIAAFAEALSVYRHVYPDGQSQYISVGLANLGTAFLEKGDYLRAETTLREAVRLSRQVLSPSHPTTAIAEIKLGRALVRLRRDAEAIPLLEQGRVTLAAQADPSVSWLQRAREDLITALERSGRSVDASRVREEAVRGVSRSR